MNKPTIFVLLTAILINCSGHKVKSEIEFQLFDIDGVLLDKVLLSDITQIDWKSQTYHLSEKKVSELKRFQLYNCRFDLVFEEKLLARIPVSYMASSNYPQDYFVDMESILDDGELHIGNLKGSGKNILENDQYHKYLTATGLLK